MSRVVLKSGVVFKATQQGGLLLDVSGDRFLALRPLGARLWQRCAIDGSVESLLTELERLNLDVAPEVAQSLVGRQLEHWRTLGLLDAASPDSLPVSKPISQSARGEFTPRGRASAAAAVRLLTNEMAYRRLLRRHGLATALVRLQQQSTSQSERGDVDTRISPILLTYRALRCVHRQGDSARDCLIRSLSLAAVLRQSGIAADLCIGVREMPFASHAWVEWGDRILNETHAKVVTFEPMARF